MSESNLNTGDRALIEEFQAGEDYAFSALYFRYKDAVYAFCVKMLLNKEIAQDVTQDTFLRIYENRKRLLKTDSFKSWLFTIARNQCLNQLRRNNWQIPLDPDMVHPKMITDAKKTPAAELEKSEKIYLVNRFLAELKPDYREVIILREYQNMSYEEIAIVTRSTLSAIKSRLFKARRKLGVYLEEALGKEVERIRTD
ncbi:MAG: RNA polymerase sigma factor [Rhodothermaceae bacterium]|nr:RNA polymerase sigma factor [Rhodothermaceae bacterium]